MKKLLLLIFILAFVQIGFAGNRYTYSGTSGVLDIKPSTITPSLKHGDTLDFPANGVYVAFNVTDLQGLPGDSIVFRFLPGSVITTNLGFVLGDWTHSSYIKVIGANFHNVQGTPIAFRAKCHSITFDNFSIVNDFGRYADKPAIVADDMYLGEMFFSGSKDQTFYEIEFKHGTIEGYQNTDVIRLGTDNNRSICTDFVFADVEFRNITNTYQTPGVPIAGTCYNLKVYDCLFEDIMSNPGAFGVHGGCIFLYGYVEAHNNMFRNVYANDIRLCPLQWTGLPGYSGPNSRSKIYNNISSHQRSFSFVETSPNNAGPRLANGGGKVFLGGTDVYYNTVYHTNRASYNGDYYGYIVDVYADSVRVYNNVIIAPEADRPWSPSTRNYMVSMPGATRFPFDSSGNKVYRTLFEAGITDTVNWTLSATSPLVNKAVSASITTVYDKFYMPRPQGVANDIGAVELSSVPVGDIPPIANAGPDTTLPGPGTVTLNGTASSDPDGTIVRYKWTKVSGPANVTIVNDTLAVTTVTGFTPGVYIFQLVVTDNLGATAVDQKQVTINQPPNQMPVANAGTDQSLPTPAPATLDGSASTDPDGTISQYRWAQVSGSAVTFSNTSAVKPTITGLQPGTYIFELTVTDNRGGTDADSVEVVVNGSVNQAPVAYAGPDQSLPFTTTTTLDGSGSSDPDGTITYEWFQTAGPTGVTINSTNSINPVLNGLQTGIYTFELVVTDNQGTSATDKVQITVSAPPNQVPVASAGTDITLPAPGPATLIGSASYDPDGYIAQYNWGLISGPTSVSISNNMPTAPVSGLQPGVYLFQLIVTDNRGDVDMDTVQVTVNSNQSPVANAGPDQSLPFTNNASLNGSASSDPDGSISQYNWVQTSGPNSAGISNTAAVSPAITGLVPGAYVFQLTVTDNAGATATDNVQISISAPPNQSPVANAGPDQSLPFTNNASLNGSASSDPDGSISQYNWVQTSGPNTAGISNTAAVSPAITGLAAGVYVFQLTVTDNAGATATDNVQISIGALNQAPTANAGQDMVLSGPQGISLDGSGSSDADGSILSYGWAQTGGPGGSTIINSNSVSPSIIGLQAGVYTFQLTVGDNQGATATDNIQVTVNAVVLALPPIANPGKDTTIAYPSSTATLNGSASYSPDGANIVAWSWKQVSGPSTAFIQQANSAVTSIARLTTGGDYQFELTVTDSKGQTGKSIVKVGVFVPLRFTGAIKIYPNPVVSSFVTIDGINDDRGQVRVTMTDISGKTAKQWQFEKTTSTFRQQLDVSQLTNGTYVLQVEFSQTGHSYTFKVVKQ
jgi:hypothetical protein